MKYLINMTLNKPQAFHVEDVEDAEALPDSNYADICT